MSTDLAPAELTAEEARALTDRIRAGVAELLPVIREAFERRADVALGYASWQEYCDTELRGLRLPVGDRREAVAELRQTGMSARAIGAALGISHPTVLKDLEATGKDLPVDQPDRIVSLDGRARPATQPPREPEPDPLPQPIAEQIEQRIAEKTAPAGRTCEACGKPIDDLDDAGYTRCGDCDEDGEHFLRNGVCFGCKPEPEPIPRYSAEEARMMVQVQNGQTVVASLRGQHANLIRWAEAEGRYVRIDRRTEWGNPFELPADGDRDTVIANYRDHYLPNKPSLLAKLDSLRGKVLGCWCAPEPCHGDVLKERAQC